MEEFVAWLSRELHQTGDFTLGERTVTDVQEGGRAGVYDFTITLDDGETFSVSIGSEY